MCNITKEESFNAESKKSKEEGWHEQNQEN